MEKAAPLPKSKVVGKKRPAKTTVASIAKEVKAPTTTAPSVVVP